jgi:hypothetical protein
MQNWNVVRLCCSNERMSLLHCSEIDYVAKRGSARVKCIEMHKCSLVGRRQCGIGGGLRSDQSVSADRGSRSYPPWTTTCPFPCSHVLTGEPSFPSQASFPSAAGCSSPLPSPSPTFSTSTSRPDVCIVNACPRRLPASEASRHHRHSFGFRRAAVAPAHRSVGPVMNWRRRK